MEIDYLKAFYAYQHDEFSLIEQIDSLLNLYNRLQAKSFPCFIDKNFLESLSIRPGFKVLSQNRNITLFEYSRIIKSKLNPETIEGKFFLVSNEEYENIYSVITIADSKYFSRGLLELFSKLYPKISLTFITHKKLQNLLVNFRDNNDFKDFKIIRTSMKSRVEKTVFSSVNWPEFSLETAFEWVKDENGWFESLTVEIQKDIFYKFNLSISRNGVIRTNGFFKLIYDYFLTSISKTVHDNMKFFGRRARLENDGNIKPLCIDYGYELFKSVDENKRFIEAMKKLKAASVSVIHGNPYIQLSIFDYFDGSSYDIWVLSVNKIIIVPQLKSSFQAVKRLINHIFDNYYEGSIKEYQYT